MKADSLVLVKKLSDIAINGVGPLEGAQTIAENYIVDTRLPTPQSKVDSLINWETSKNFTSGFITSLGGLITLPAGIVGALGASWAIQARMSAAIAVIGGYDIKDDRIKTMVVMSLLGDSCKEILKDFGVKLGTKLSQKLLERIPGRIFIEINKRIGFRLITKSGEKGLVNLARAIPFISGPIGGSIDAISCRVVGKAAKSLFIV